LYLDPCYTHKTETSVHMFSGRQTLFSSRCLKPVL